MRSLSRPQQNKRGTQSTYVSAVAFILAPASEWPDLGIGLCLDFVNLPALVLHGKQPNPVVCPSGHITLRGNMLRAARLTCVEAVGCFRAMSLISYSCASRVRLTKSCCPGMSIPHLYGTEVRRAPPIPHSSCA